MPGSTKLMVGQSVSVWGVVDCDVRRTLAPMDHDSVGTEASFLGRLGGVLVEVVGPGEGSPAVSLGEPSVDIGKAWADRTCDVLTQAEHL